MTSDFINTDVDTDADRDTATIKRKERKAFYDETDQGAALSGASALSTGGV